eukprot:2340587-Karenia_brevis.AAC.1
MAMMMMMMMMMAMMMILEIMILGSSILMVAHPKSSRAHGGGLKWNKEQKKSTISKAHKRT